VAENVARDPYPATREEVRSGARFGVLRGRRGVCVSWLASYEFNASRFRCVSLANRNYAPELAVTRTGAQFANFGELRVRRERYFDSIDGP